MFRSELFVVLILWTTEH